MTTRERGSPHLVPPISTLITPELALLSCGSKLLRVDKAPHQALQIWGSYKPLMLITLEIALFSCGVNVVEASFVRTAVLRTDVNILCLQDRCACTGPSTLRARAN